MQILRIITAVMLASMYLVAIFRSSNESDVSGAAISISTLVTAAFFAWCIYLILL